MRALTERFEWVFWTALAVLIATGIGNLAASGGFAAPDSRWGVAFTLKMGAVLVLAAISIVRTVHVLHVAAGGDGSRSVQRGPYRFTAVLGVLALGLAQVMAHG